MIHAVPGATVGIALVRISRGFLAVFAARKDTWKCSGLAVSYQYAARLNDSRRLASLRSNVATASYRFIDETATIDASARAGSGFGQISKMRRHANSLFVPSADIARMETGKGAVAVHLNDGKTHTFLSKQIDRMESDLQRFAAGDDVFDTASYDRSGFNAACDAPALVLESLVGGAFDHAAVEKRLARAAEDERYMATFRACYAPLKRDEKARAATSIARFPHEFRRIFVAQLRRDRRRKRIGCIGIAAAVAFPLVLGIFITLFVDADADYGAAGIATIVLIAYALVCWWLLRRVMKTTGYDLPLLDEE